MSTRKLSLIALPAILLSLVLRFAYLGTKPGWELDEVVYAKIVTNFMTSGYIWLTQGHAYYSHPPFYFWLLRWVFDTFGAGITQGRYLAAITQVIAIALLTFLVIKITGSAKSGLTVAILALFDGWLVFTGRVGWMENTQSIFIVASVLSYYLTADKEKPIWGILPGLVIGVTIVFKFIGIFMLLFVIFAWLLNGRKYTDKHMMILYTIIAAPVIYFAVNLLSPHGAQFWGQTENQLFRMLGAKFSPGLNYGIAPVLSAITSHYWIFFTDIALIAGGGLFVAISAIRAVIERGGEKDQTLLAWAASAVVFLGVISLKSPHYFILMLVPIIAVIGVELSKLSGKALIPVIIGFIALSALTWQLRYNRPNDHLLEDVQAYATQNIPAEAKVFSTEPVCSVIPQSNCDKLEGKTPDLSAAAISNADWVLAYSSTTQLFPDVPGTPLTILKGFKDQIAVYKNH